MFFISFSRFPFDWQNPTGYAMAVLIQITFLFIVMLNAKCLSTFIIGTCLMLISLTKDIKYELYTVDRHRKKVKRNRWQIERQFFELIPFSSNVRQLSEYDMPQSIHLIWTWTKYNLISDWTMIFRNYSVWAFWLYFCRALQQYAVQC